MANMDNEDDTQYKYYDDLLEELQNEIYDSAKKLLGKTETDDDKDKLYYLYKENYYCFDELLAMTKAEEENDKFYDLTKDICDRVKELSAKTESEEDEEERCNSSKNIYYCSKELSAKTESEVDEEERNSFNESDLEQFSNMSIQDHEYNGFKVLSTEEIVKIMEDSLTQINSIFKIPKSATRILLNYLDWDVMEVADRLSENKEKLFKEAGVLNCQYTQPGESTILVEIGRKECKICFADVSKMIELNCGHQFCELCWREYLIRKITVEGSLGGIVCMSHGCGLLVNDEFIMRMVPTTVTDVYQQLIMNSFVESNNRLTRCPASGCSNAILVDKDHNNEVTCRCGEKFCFSCKEIWHDPIDCQLFKKWLINYSEEPRRIGTSRKVCPNCNSITEGCGSSDDAHVSCRKGSERYEFCWTCLHVWSSHDQTCQGDVDKEENSPTESKTQHEKSERYKYYYKLYKHHLLRLSSEENILSRIISNKVNVASANLLVSDIKVLGQSRQTLMVTYALAFYLEENDANSLFLQHHQNILEDATNRLFGVLKEVAVSGCIKDFTEVFNVSLYCADRRQKLVEFVREGYDIGWWKFSV